jgi:N utilization substance protein A
VDPGDGLLRDFDLDEESASAMIMAARAHWFEDEDKAAEAAKADDAEGAEAAENAETTEVEA